MNPAHTIQTLRTVMATAERIGATVPKAATAEYRSVVKLFDAVHNLNRTPVCDIHARTLAVLEAGDDPLEDPELRREVLRRTICGDTSYGLDQAIAVRALALVETHADAVLEAFRKPFDKTAQVMTAALDHLATVALDDTNTIANLGPTAAAAWSNVITGEDTIRGITQSWKLLSSVTRRVPWDARYGLLAIADVPPATYIEEHLTKVKLRPWEVVKRGWTLSYATTDVLADRIAAVQQQAAQQQAERDGAAQAAWRRQSNFLGGKPDLTPAA